MRREKFEFSVSPPTVVYRRIDGQQMEPLEEVHCEVEDENAGSVIEALTLRRAELQEMVPLQVPLDLTPTSSLPLQFKKRGFLEKKNPYLSCSHTARCS
jgi:predicted membrane GTPase involved in stress response